MIKSMTGFGRCEYTFANTTITAEVKSLNSRSRDIILKIPKNLASFEPKIVEIIKSYITRGRVTLSLSCDNLDDTSASLTLDEALAEKYYQMMLQLKNKFNLAGDVDLHTLVSMSDMFKVEKQPPDLDAIWGYVKQVIETATKELVKMRCTEGEQLFSELVTHINKLTHNVDTLEKRAPQRIKEAQSGLHEKVKNLLCTEEVDEQRIAMEIALLAEKVDITEECARLRSHIQQFRNIMENEDVAGRKLDFLLQEMHREASTISAKANDTEIVYLVISLKEEIEKLREQVQNIE